MAEVTHVVLVCDVHGEESGCLDVQTHALAVDGKAREFEVCAKEWAKVEKVTAALLEKGRAQVGVGAVLRAGRQKTTNGNGRGAKR